jgi:hypothetical protein
MLRNIELVRLIGVFFKSNQIKSNHGLYFEICRDEMNKECCHIDFHLLFMNVAIRNFVSWQHNFICSNFLKFARRKIRQIGVSYVISDPYCQFFDLVSRNNCETVELGSEQIQTVNPLV